MDNLLPILCVYSVLSVLTLVVYAVDKIAARKGLRRTPEKTLHTLALLGGWPGAIVAQQLLRHKTAKKPFQRVFWLSVCVNLSCLAGLKGLVYNG